MAAVLSDLLPCMSYSPSTRRGVAGFVFACCFFEQGTNWHDSERMNLDNLLLFDSSACLAGYFEKKETTRI
jgi:hypothetical protein